MPPRPNAAQVSVLQEAFVSLANAVVQELGERSSSQAGRQAGKEAKKQAHEQADCPFCGHAVSDGASRQAARAQSDRQEWLSTILDLRQEASDKLLQVKGDTWFGPSARRASPHRCARGADLLRCVGLMVCRWSAPRRRPWWTFKPPGPSCR